jgi:hypothetical protein
MTAVTDHEPNVPDFPQRLLLREVNERIREISISFGLANGSFELICECGQVGCFQRIDVSASVYERARIEPCRFVVAPGHDGNDTTARGRQPSGRLHGH